MVTPATWGRTGKGTVLMGTIARGAPRDVAVIICAYTEHRWDDLVDAIASLRAQTLAPAEIVLVVDGNQSLAARARSDLNGVTIVENVEERGLSGARNTGIATASSEILAFLDDDAIADENWLQRLVEPYSNPAVIGVGGAVKPFWLGVRPGWFPEEFLWVVGCSYRGLPESTSAVRNMIGCNMSLRREAFELVGTFSHGIGRVGTRPVGCEETELCIRVRQRRPAALILYEPGSSVLHRVPAARATPAYFLARCYSEGISKSLVSRLVGARDGLESERAYVTKTLPAGVFQGLVDGISGRPAGMARAGAIAAGLLVTALGYLVGKLAARGESSRDSCARHPAELPSTVSS